MGSENLHEPFDLLSEETKNRHRAIVSLMEELEAVDWYSQRADVIKDPELKAVLIHNRNEEIEHAMMTLEWLRRNFPEFDENIATYIKAKGSIVGAEAASEGRVETGDEGIVDASPTGIGSASFASLGIGSLKDK